MMMLYIEKIVLLLATVFAICSIQTKKMKHAILYMGMFSFFCSILYIFYKSPNVAIAEASIGCTLSLAIYLVALKKQKKFLIYVYYDISHELLELIEGFCEHEDLIFHYIRFKEDKYEEIINTKDYNLVIHKKHDDVFLFSKEINDKVEALANTLSYKIENSNIQLFEMSDNNDMEII
ncbi:MAG: DUF4040 domain-containing protein [Clostridia bacterium]|jgi:uncharacterized MnhB-related membrane protein|nr:DUF4040 domain-containing protein [Clostridia bacterium]